MKLIKHLSAQPFIVATGFAALIHSTWSLGTFFSGKQPGDPVAFALWLVPALLIAFSLDIGQIVTSAEIRAGQRSRGKYLTFGVFAVATYFLQFCYCAAHMPAIELAAGVRSDWSGTISFIRDSAVFIVPALLPLSTLLYTFSQEQSELPMQPAVAIAHEQPQNVAAVQINIDQRTAQIAAPATPAIAEAAIEQPQLIAETVAMPAKFLATCPHCDWTKECDTPRSVTNSLNAHLRGCKAKLEVANAR